MDLTGIREASRLIFVDELTGLYNRRFMRQYLRERLDQLARERTSLAVIMLDLDGFKQINDTYGHLDGDRILKRLAEIISAALPANAYAIRFAGDEFFAFVEGVDASEGVRVAEAIRERVNTERFSTEKAPDGIPVRISLGVAAYPEDAPAPSELIEAADQALYRSKRSGKNCVSRAGSWTLPAEAEILKRFPCPRLVGRDDALAELERSFGGEGTERKNRFILVEANRGVGKTRLLLEVMRRASARGLTCLLGRCLESQRAIPYSSLSQLLTDYLSRDTQQRDLVKARLSRQAASQVGALIVPLAAPGEAAKTLTPEDRRSVLFHGMEDVLCLVSERAPLLLFLDDLHFVDEASLEVLYRLLDREEGRVIVFAAAQSEALARQEGGALPLARLFALLRQSRNFQRVGLGSLPLPHVTEMVTEILQRHTASPAFFQRLYEASEGIPLFVEETVKGLITKGLLRTTDGMWNLDAVEPAAVPASLEAAVLEGLEGLDQEFRTMITKAAVVGPRVDVELLAGVLGKNEGETQQLVDQGKNRRVFEEPGPLADEDEVRFLSHCFQQIVYTNLDQDSRRKTHRTVGEVAERLAGDRVDKVLGPLAFHFERSDDAAKGALYRQRVQEMSGQLFSAAEIAEELSLKVDVETVRPLDERTWPFADRFLRALTVAVKNMRVYPAGSQIVVHNAAAAKARLLELLGRVETVAFAEETQALQINGAPVESIGLVPIAQDLLRVYADHGIRRMTLERGMTEADVMGLLKILSGSPEGIKHDVAYWENRLKSERIGHVRLFPVIFLAAAGEGRAVWRREEKEAQLDDRTLALVRDTLRALAAAVDNIRLYPPESELITLSLDQVERQAQALFTGIPSLTVGMAEGTIVVNATRPNPRLFGITIEILDRLMEDGGLTSLTIRRGVSREDLRLFLTNLSQPPSEAKGGPAFWRGVLEGRGIRTIEVGTRTYAAAARLEEAQVPEPEAPPPESVTPPAPQPSEAERMLELAARWLKDPLEVFLELQVQEELAPILVGLRGLGREDLATQLVGRTAGALREADGKIRGWAAQGVAHCMARMDDNSRPWLLAKILDPLCGAVRRETQREAFQAEVALATEILNRLVGAGDFASAARLSEALGGPLQNLGPEAEWFGGVVRGLVDALTAAGVMETVLNALKDADPARRQEAGAILGGLGAAAVPLLLRVTLEGNDEEIYRAAAGLLRAQGEAGVRLLTQELERSASIAQLTRIVAVLDVISPALGNEFLFLLGHPEVEVRAEIARTLARLPREQATRFLGHALGQRKSEVVLGGLECVRGLRVVELLDSVVRLIENPPNDHLQRVACMSLGGLKDARAVTPLVEILGRRPRFFGLVKGLPEAIRATAARSLGELAFLEAKEALQVALRDRSKTVRSASRLALLRVQQELEAKPKS